MPAPLADSEGEEQKAVTDVTDVTDSISVGGCGGEDAHTEGPTQRLSVTSVTSVTEERPPLAPEGGKKVPLSEEDRLFWELVRQKAPGPGKQVEKRWLREELAKRGIGPDQVDRIIRQEERACRLVDRGSCLLLASSLSTSSRGLPRRIRLQVDEQNQISHQELLGWWN